MKSQKTDVIRTPVKIGFLEAFWKTDWEKILHVPPICLESTENPFGMSARDGEKWVPAT